MKTVDYKWCEWIDIFSVACSPPPQENFLSSSVKLANDHMIQTSFYLWNEIYTSSRTVSQFGSPFVVKSQQVEISIQESSRTKQRNCLIKQILFIIDWLYIHRDKTTHLF